MTYLSSTITKLRAKDNFALQKVWENIDVNSCPYYYNFHAHTVFSDGKLTPENLIEQAIRIGLKDLAITDHHAIAAYYIAQNYLTKIQGENPNLNLPFLWTGVEINAVLGDTNVHILGYGFDPKHSAISPYLQSNIPENESALAPNVISAIHEANGLAVLAHPARYRRCYSELIPIAYELGIDGIEVYYSYNNPKPWKPSLEICQKVRQITEKYGLFATCGTDTHGSDLLMRT
jgi:predicted metal-dependent phosphoesterase TrpH